MGVGFTVILGDGSGIFLGLFRELVFHSLSATHNAFSSRLRLLSSCFAANGSIRSTSGSGHNGLSLCFFFQLVLW